MEKQFNTMYNIGKSRYVINYHDGVGKHEDGSPFFEIMLFQDKKKFNKERKKLLDKGYKETN